MVNYNSDSPKERGFWYDAIITRKVGGWQSCPLSVLVGNEGKKGHELEMPVDNDGV